MIKNFVKNHWQILFFNFILCLIFVVFYGHFGDVFVDSFREAYIPKQILEGKLLYKNIFTIYAPFAYLFNALLFKVFGVNISVLYFAGFIATIVITNLTYKISRIFLDKDSSFAIVMFFIAAAVLSPNVFNTIFPYSYGMLYGLLFVLLSIYFSLTRKFPLSYFFYSLAICSKYEFILLLPLLIYASRTKDWWKNLVALITPIIIIGGILLASGINLNNIFTSFALILAMCHAKTLHWFYSISGLEFRIEHLWLYFVNLIKIVVPLFCLIKFKPKYTILPILVYLFLVISPAVIIFAFPLILAGLIYKFKILDKDEKFFIIASILISLKVFWALALKSYGVFFIPFALISIFILCRNVWRKRLAILVLIIAIALLGKNSNELFAKNVKLQTERGVVYTTQFYGNSLNQLISFVKKETPNDSKIVVFPECLSVNFLTDRKSDDKFYSLIPLYVETFGEDLIIKRFELLPPDYVIISNYDTSDYFYKEFGRDYATKIAAFVEQNYSLLSEIKDGMSFFIYKKD